MEGTNNESKKCIKDSWQLLVHIRLWQDDRLMKDSGQYVSQVQWKQNPATLRTQRKCQTATQMCSSDYSLVYTNTPSYWGFHSSWMWCCVTCYWSLKTWKDPLTCQDHSPSNTASYPRGPESSAVCCENLKFCRMLVWQNAECNIYVCNFLNTEHPSFLNV